MKFQRYRYCNGPTLSDVSSSARNGTLELCRKVKVQVRFGVPSQGTSWQSSGRDGAMASAKWSHSVLQKFMVSACVHKKYPAACSFLDDFPGNPLWTAPNCHWLKNLLGCKKRACKFTTFPHTDTHTQQHGFQTPLLALELMLRRVLGKGTQSVGEHMEEQRKPGKVTADSFRL